MGNPGRKRISVFFNFKRHRMPVVELFVVASSLDVCRTLTSCQKTFVNGKIIAFDHMKSASDYVVCSSVTGSGAQPRPKQISVLSKRQRMFLVIIIIIITRLMTHVKVIHRVKNRKCSRKS